MSVAPSSRAQKLSLQRDAMYAELKTALEDEADPLAAYDNLVRWTINTYADHSDSGLLELLEESVRVFKDDARYKFSDLRYLKLWILYANYVEKPVPIYAYMMDNGIGKPYALFFQEYAEALERERRYSDSETVITLGIHAQAKPLKHLQTFQDSYRARRAVGKLPPMKLLPFRDHTTSATLNAIRGDPLRNIAPRQSSSVLSSNLSIPVIGQHDVSMTTTQMVQPTRPRPYAHLNAPPDPGKRPQKLMFDLTLLLEPDGTEYSFVEARARHLGLLNKKWPPPPLPNAALTNGGTAANAAACVEERSVKVDFSDHGSKKIHPRRQSVTVTINTKQALEDVFDMYNSPLKEGGNDEAAVGIKPLTDTSENLRTPVSVSRASVIQDENANVASTRPEVSQPYVDPKRENVTPGPLKFKPITTKTPGSNIFTPNVVRKALVPKEFITPVPAFKVRPPQDVLTLAAAESKPHNKASSSIDVFEGDDVTADEFTEEFTNGVPPRPPPRPFVPFVDDNTENRLPPTSQPNAQGPTSSRILKFQVHRDENVPPAPAVRLSGVGGRTPSQGFFPPARQEQVTSSVDESPQDEEEIQEVEDRRFVKSSRFADFDVMTPITERTFEYTVSTRAIDTPRSDQLSMLDKGFVPLDAQDVAEQLAVELQEEDEQEQDIRAGGNGGVATTLLDQEFLSVPGEDESVINHTFSSFDQSRAPFRVSDGFTIEHNQSTLLPFTAIVKSTAPNLEDLHFKSELPNPCNPSDPGIVSRFLSVLPVEPDHRDLQNRVANNLNKMERFVEKRARRGSAASGTGRVSEESECMALELDGDLFEVYAKLGEGGFGAVFMAKDMSKARQRFDEEGDEEEDGDADLVAVKVVRPTNVWESYMLRRIIAALPEDLRRSIIQPHHFYAFKDESYLILDLCQQGTLLEIVNRATEIGIAQPGGGVDELLVMFFTVELLRILQGLHDRGFIHGDLKIDNCLIRLEDVPGSVTWSSEYSPAGEGGWASKGLKLIDFGRTIDMGLYPAGQTFVADWKTDARDCAEMREGLPWTYQTDYAGLASIVYCMLFGKYMDKTVEVTSSPESGSTRQRGVKPSQPMKRYWQGDLWNRLFDALLNPRLLRPDGSLPVTKELASLRVELETWIRENCNKSGRNLKGMLKKIEIASLRRVSRK